MPLNYQTARTIVLKHLKTHNVLTGINAREILNASQLGGDANDADDCALVYRVFHDLYLDRVIVSGTSNANGDKPMMWPFCTLTPYGARVITVDEWQPYDPDGYLDALKRAVPNVDATILRYLSESLGCLNRDLLLASAVMLGCASEKAVLLLGEAFSNAIADPAKKAKYDREWSVWQIAKKYQALLDSHSSRFIAAGKPQQRIAAHSRSNI